MKSKISLSTCFIFLLISLSIWGQEKDMSIIKLKPDDEVKAKTIIANTLEVFVWHNEIQNCKITMPLTIYIDTNGHVYNIIMPQSEVEKIVDRGEENKIELLREISSRIKKLILPVTTNNIEGNYYPVRTKFPYILEFSMVNSSEKYHFTKEDHLVDRDGKDVKPEIKEQVLKICDKPHIIDVPLNVKFYEFDIGSKKVKVIRSITYRDGSHTRIYSNTNIDAPVSNQNTSVKDTMRLTVPVATILPKTDLHIQSIPIEPHVKPALIDVQKVDQHSDTINTIPTKAEPVVKYSLAEVQKKEQRSDTIVNISPKSEVKAAIESHQEIKKYDPAIYDKIITLKKLLDAGAITTEEFDAEKRKLIDY